MKEALDLHKEKTIKEKKEFGRDFLWEKKTSSRGA